VHVFLKSITKRSSIFGCWELHGLPRLSVLLCMISVPTCWQWIWLMHLGGSCNPATIFLDSKWFQQNNKLLALDRNYKISINVINQSLLLLVLCQPTRPHFVQWQLSDCFCIHCQLRLSLSMFPSDDACTVVFAENEMLFCFCDNIAVLQWTAPAIKSQDILATCPFDLLGLSPVDKSSSYWRHNLPSMIALLWFCFVVSNVVMCNLSMMCVLVQKTLHSNQQLVLKWSWDDQSTLLVQMVVQIVTPSCRMHNLLMLTVIIRQFQREFVTSPPCYQLPSFNSIRIEWLL